MSARKISGDWLKNLIEDGPLRASSIYHLSEPSRDTFERLTEVWPSIRVERRRQIMARLAETLETDFQVDFSSVALFGIRDSDSEVRRHAIGALWTNESTDVLTALMGLLQDDASIEVRATAAEALGRFVLLGEDSIIPKEAAHAAENELLAILNRAHERSQLYLRALGSFAYASRPEAEELIRQAANHESVEVRATALLSMGRQGDEQWKEPIVKSLRDAEPALRYEAAKAAGELGLTEAIDSLIDLTRDVDREVREAAIWALGEIGGSEAREELARLARNETDEDILEAINDALSMAALVSGNVGFYSVGGGSNIVTGEPDDD